MKILLIRRDNLGDLILTTPLIAQLARAHCVDVLVNTYNQPVLEGNPHVRRVHLYAKLNHETSLPAKVGVLWRRLKTLYAIWREHYDVAIVAKEHWDKRPMQWARASRAPRIIAIGEDAPACVTDKIPFPQEPVHIVELLQRLAAPLGLNEPPGALELYPAPEEITRAAQKIPREAGVPTYGLQISARKLRQRWPVERFIALAHRLAQRERCRIVLFWSPGSQTNPFHPGDDENAQRIVEACADIAVTPFRSENIRDLMAGMALCDQIVTSDGGALHVAAGVGKPVVALFGNSHAHFWGPWKVPARVLEGREQNVANLSVEEVLAAFVALREETGRDAGHR